MQRPAGRSGVRLYVGRMDVSPKHGPAGTPVTVTAEGLPPGEEFQIVWVTYNPLLGLAIAPLEHGDTGEHRDPLVLRSHVPG
jgi:hypothetical protein